MLKIRHLDRAIAHQAMLRRAAKRSAMGEVVLGGPGSAGSIQADVVRKRETARIFAEAEAVEEHAGAFPYATSGPRLELDVMLSALIAAIYDACLTAIAADQPLPAPDVVGIEEVKAIQRWALEHLPDRIIDSKGRKYLPDAAALAVAPVADDVAINECLRLADAFAEQVSIDGFPKDRTRLESYRLRDELRRAIRSVASVAALLRGGKTGWPPGMLQDDSRELSKWFAGQPGARGQIT